MLSSVSATTPASVLMPAGPDGEDLVQNYIRCCCPEVRPVFGGMSCSRELKHECRAADSA